MAAPIKKHAALLLGCLATAAATQGVPKEVVESALVFDGSSAMGLKDNNDAAQCLRWAVVASLRDGYSQAFVSLPEATAYVKGGETDTKVSFTVSATGIEAVHVRDDLMSAAMEPSNPDYASEFMVALSNCSWPYDKIDQDASEHVLQSETYRHSSFADAGAIVSSAVVLEGFRAHNFNADEVAITQFGITVAAVLQAATVQIDNVVAEEYRPPSIQDDDDPAAPVANDDPALVGAPAFLGGDLTAQLGGVRTGSPPSTPPAEARSRSYFMLKELYESMTLLVSSRARAVWSR